MQRCKVACSLILGLLCACGSTVQAAEMAAPVEGWFWGLRPEISQAERSQLVDKALGNQETHPAYSPEVLSRILEENGGIVLAAGETNQEYFVNPEPSSMLVWVTSTMGILAAGYGYRRRSA